jgi:hypothetical protein
MRTHPHTNALTHWWYHASSKQTSVFISARYHSSHFCQSCPFSLHIVTVSGEPPAFCRYIVKSCHKTGVNCLTILWAKYLLNTNGGYNIKHIWACPYYAYAGMKDIVIEWLVMPGTPTHTVLVGLSGDLIHKSAILNPKWDHPYKTL